MVTQAIESAHVERVMMLPSFDPPHKGDDGMAPFEHRAAMLRAAVENELESFHKQDQIFVSEIEATLPPPSFTYQTMRVIQEEHAKMRLKLMIGYDMYAYLPHWENLPELVDKYDFLVFRRQSSDDAAVVAEEIEQICGQPPSVTFATNDDWPVSSTLLRKLIKEFNATGARDAALEKWLPPASWSYIQKHDLYN